MADLLERERGRIGESEEDRVLPLRLGVPALLCSLSLSFSEDGGRGVPPFSLFFCSVEGEGGGLVSVAYGDPGIGDKGCPLWYASGLACEEVEPLRLCWPDFSLELDLRICFRIVLGGEEFEGDSCEALPGELRVDD